jgi:DNA-binding NarL/FixJ family response regulator
VSFDLYKLGGYMPIRVFVAYNQKVMAEGLAAVLRENPEISVVGVCDSHHFDVSKINNLTPDVVVIGSSAIDMKGHDLCEFISAHSAVNHFVVISSEISRALISDALKAGAKAHVCMNSNIDDLMSAIRLAAVGSSYLCESSMHELTCDAEAPLSQVIAVKRALGERETQVLCLVAVGRSSKQIARNLDISPSTVEVHRRNIMRKLDLHKVADLTRFAIRHQMISV